jgi:hypothetical protein
MPQNLTENKDREDFIFKFFCKLDYVGQTQLLMYPCHPNLVLSHTSNIYRTISFMAKDYIQIYQSWHVSPLYGKNYGNYPVSPIRQKYFLPWEKWQKGEKLNLG